MACFKREKMGFLDFFKSKKKNQDVQVTEHKRNIMQDAAAAAAFAEAGEHETARTMIDTPAGKRSILVIGREDNFSEILENYALNMAQRMNAELISLNVSEEPLNLVGDEREAATIRFRQDSEANVVSLKEKAMQNSITFSHLVEIGAESAALKKIHTQFPEVRYVLTEPDPEAVREAKGNVTVPVCDMACYLPA
jgi:hypothetical protein